MAYAEMLTDKGLMKIEFYTEDAPIHVKNFTDLSKNGFYDGLTFHRVIPDFVVQGGDPDGTGGGGPGYSIPCELTGNNQYHDRGVLSMAHRGPNTGGSQFFINVKDNTYLDNKHAVFGSITEGQDIVMKISEIQTSFGDKPVEDVKITSINILDEN